MTTLEKAQSLRCAQSAVAAAYRKYASLRESSRALTLGFLQRHPFGKFVGFKNP
jgi:hypothetical protein